MGHPSRNVRHAVRDAGLDGMGEFWSRERKLGAIFFEGMWPDY